MIQTLKTLSVGEKLVLLLFLTLPFERVLTWEFVGFTIKPPYIAGIILIAYSVWHFWKSRKTIRLALPEKFLLAFIFFSLVTIIWSIDPQKTIIISLMFVFMFLIYLSVRYLIGKKNPEFFYRLFIGIGLVCSLFSLWQFFGDILHLSPNYTFLGDDYISGVFPFPRVQSTFFEPLFFANFLQIPLFLSLYQMTKKRSWPLILSLFIIGLAFFLTLSRGGIIAFLIVLFFVGILMIFWLKDLRRAFLNYLIVLLISFLAALSIIFGFTGRNGIKTYFKQVINNTDMVDYTEEFSKNKVTRSYTIKVALETWSRHPFGIGNGAFGSLHEFDWVVKEQGNKRQTVNSLYPEILVELGLVGLLLFLSFLATTFWRYYYDFKQGRLISLFFAGIISSMFIQYIAFSTLYLVYLWVFMGLASIDFDKNAK